MSTKKNGKKVIKLRTTDDLAAAYEWLFEQQTNGQIDPKQAHLVLATLKGQVYLLGKLPLDMARLILQAKIKEQEIQKFLPKIGQV